VFAALVSLALALIEEIPSELMLWRLARVGLKVLAFFVIGYLTLRSSWGRNWLAYLLGKFKTEEL
jgi:hypothetical protein